MSTIPRNLRFTTTHEWVREETDGVVTIGITDHAQELLGDLVFVELPDIGAEINAGDECCVVESVKAAADVYAPVDGQIAEVNTALQAQPELINQDPFGQGWLWKMQLAKDADLSALLDADGYSSVIAD